MIEDYLNHRQTLRAIVLLVDIRHEPGENDRLMHAWLKHYGYQIIVVATKSDKISRNQMQKQLSLIRKGLQLEQGDILIPFSGEKKTGVEELWTVLDTYLED